MLALVSVIAIHPFAIARYDLLLLLVSLFVRVLSLVLFLSMSIGDLAPLREEVEPMPCNLLFKSFFSQNTKTHDLINFSRTGENRMATSKVKNHGQSTKCEC